MQTRRPSAPTVLYVAGFSRGGSTLLGNLLGQLDGAVHGGELLYVWRNLGRPRARCSCGSLLRECALWSDVVPRALDADAAAVESAVADAAAAAAAAGRRGPHRGRARARLVDISRRLYPALADAAGAGVIIDTSKLPWYGDLLRTVPEIDLHTVALVRDPRAIAWSARRSPHRRDGSVHGPTYIGARWWGTTRAADRLVSRLGERGYRLRYEDLVADPEASVAALADLVGLPHDGLSFLTSGTATLDAGHVASGNRNRFVTGPVVVAADDEWRQRLPTTSRRLVTVAAYPALRRNGYVGPRAGVR
jgi:hypothetical protein